MSIAIRPATASDADAIHHIQRAAFPTAAEANLVDALTASGDARLSLVAEDEGGIVAHLMCSRMTVEADGRGVDAVGLAPVAVRPEYQRRGIGSALIEAAIADTRTAGAEMMFVLGDPAYYGRFGFTTEVARPFASPYAGRYFQALVLSADETTPSQGRADYAPPFAALERGT